MHINIRPTYSPIIPNKHIIIPLENNSTAIVELQPIGTAGCKIFPIIIYIPYKKPRKAKKVPIINEKRKGLTEKFVNPLANH